MPANHVHERTEQGVVVAQDTCDALGRMRYVFDGRAHDKNGNRVTDSFLGRQVKATARQEERFDDEGRQFFLNVVDFDIKENVLVTESYRYDALNRLQSVQRDGVQVDYRQYDGAGRVVRSGSPDELPTGYAEKINEDRLVRVGSLASRLEKSQPEHRKRSLPEHVWPH